MALDILKERGVPLDKQTFTWRDFVRPPISKLDDDAFSRVRVILMNGIEAEQLRFLHAAARMNKDLQLPLARVRRVEHLQQACVNWRLGPDHSALETTIGFEQVAIEITAAIAQQEPEPYLAQCYRFGLLEDFDHMYRFAALMDRVEGKDANNILQCYTDVLPGRPTAVEHRAPEDELRNPYDRKRAAPITKLNAYTIMAAEHMTHDYYMVIGPQFADPVARALYAEIATIEEQHVTHYESMIDPYETWLEKWLLHEATEVYNYYSCLEQESNPELKQLWDRFLAFELGQLHFVMDLFKRVEGRDPAEILPSTLPDPIPHASQRTFIRKVLAAEADLRAVGTQFVPKAQEKPDSPSVLYREQLNKEGVPSQIVAASWRWMPGTEAAEQAASLASMEGSVQ